jgi:hypothetical protein
LGATVGFTERLTTRKPRTVADHYMMWLDDLPAVEREAVVTALRDRVAWTNAELKPILESDEEHPAPRFGTTAFRDWRNENFS